MTSASARSTGSRSREFEPATGAARRRAAPAARRLADADSRRDGRSAEHPFSGRRRLRLRPPAGWGSSPGAVAPRPSGSPSPCCGSRWMVILSRSTGADPRPAGAFLRTDRCRRSGRRLRIELTMPGTTQTPVALRVGNPGGTRFEIGRLRAAVTFDSDDPVDVGVLLALEGVHLAVSGGDGDGFLSEALPRSAPSAELDLGRLVDAQGTRSPAVPGSTRGCRCTVALGPLEIISVATCDCTRLRRTIGAGCPGGARSSLSPDRSSHR